MLSKFFWTQFNNPVKGDWTETVMDNLKDLGITEDLNVIKSKTKDTFKKHVKQKAREAALETEKLGIYRTDYSKLFQVQGN